MYIYVLVGTKGANHNVMKLLKVQLTSFSNPVLPKGLQLFTLENIPSYYKLI